MIIADTHVHLHEVFDLNAGLNAALDHFDRRTGKTAPADSVHLLCLADPAGRCSDRMLVEEAVATEGWRFSRDSGSDSVCAERNDGRTIHLLPGRQIISRENLEALALDCRMDVKDRTLPLSELIDRIREAGGIPVLPWGFGKWTGRRGRVVRELISGRIDFYVADNGNRLRGTPEPKLIRFGRERGIPVLHGSDPLPFDSETARVGSCGVVAEMEADFSSPSKAFRALLSRPDSWRIFGEGAGAWSFLKNMAGMQWRKRIGSPGHH